MATCNQCPEFTCTKPVPECALQLCLGTPDSSSDTFNVYIEKQNGARYVQEIEGVYFYANEICIDLEDPNSEFFNEYDGLYKIWVTEADAGITEYVTMLQDGIESTMYGVNFKKIVGSVIDYVDIEPIS